MRGPYYPPAERTALLSNYSANGTVAEYQVGQGKKGLAPPGVDKRKSS